MPDGSSPRTRGTRSESDRATGSRRFIPAHAGNTWRATVHGSGGSVHPRARGEHFIVRTPGGQTVRFIPAHAGNTPESKTRNQTWTVHPRARGEHQTHRGLPLTSFGSSPRTRGTLARLHRRASRGRFIPAHAGNTSDNAVSVASGSGSSPRTRGTQFIMMGGEGNNRFIPAHAGNTRDEFGEVAFEPVHPRARGEHPHPLLGGGCSVGSSPRTRGTPIVDDHAAVGRRFIPAHAGNTSRLRSRLLLHPVHPRARGEHCPPVRGVTDRRGSSPRTRGTRRRLPDRQGSARFIPAHAGNTSCHGIARPWISVHPRARGEHGRVRVRGCCCVRFIPAHAGNTPAAKAFPKFEYGSSPRTRGTLARPLRNRGLKRFIPAHAGNTPTLSC